MSLEQLIVLFILVGLPLIRALRAALEKRRQAGHPAQHEEVDEPVFYVPPVPEPPARYPVFEAPPEAPPVEAPVVRPEFGVTAPSRRHEEPVRHPPVPSRSHRRPPAASIPRDRATLRHAMVLMTIFGPPRALDR